MRDWNRLSLWVSVLAIVLMAGQSFPVLAAPPTIYDFRMTQGTANLPDIKAYVDIVGAGEVPAKGLQKEDLQAKVGSISVKVSRLIPFEDAKEGVGYVLLVDISKSLSAAQFSLMKETLTAFVDAMSERDQTQEVLDWLADPEIITVFQTAPAIRVGFGEEFGLPPGTNVEGQIIAALRQMGADVILDTNFGADVVIMEEGTELLGRLKNRERPTFTSNR